MSSKDVSMNNKENDSNDSNNNTNNHITKPINKPELKRRNAIANFELTDSYKEFMKYYKEIETKK